MFSAGDKLLGSELTDAINPTDDIGEPNRSRSCIRLKTRVTPQPVSSFPLNLKFVVNFGKLNFFLMIFIWFYRIRSHRC